MGRWYENRPASMEMPRYVKSTEIDYIAYRVDEWAGCYFKSAGSEWTHAMYFEPATEEEYHARREMESKVIDIENDIAEKSKRKQAKKILFEKLKFQGHHYLLFPEGELKDDNAIIDTIIDAMFEFKRK